MKFVKRIGGGAAMLIGFGLCAPPAQAAYVVTLDQVGSNIVATGSGSIDLSGLSYLETSAQVVEIVPTIAFINTGPTVPGEPSQPDGLQDFYTGFTPGPESIGPGFATPFSSSSGDLVGIEGNSAPTYDQLLVPAGYVSGSALSSSATWDDATFASLGVTPGTYVWTWGNGADADSFTLDVGMVAVPEPPSLLLFGVALAGLMLVRASRRSLDAG
jgi:hypothetical protein